MNSICGKRVLVAGSLVLDILPRFGSLSEEELLQGLLAQGKLTESSGFSIYLGGEVGNTGQALGKLGVPVRLLSKVGDDMIGSIVLDMLERSGMEYCVSTMPNTNSTASIALAIPNRDKSTIHLRGASQLFDAGDFDEKTFENVDLFHFGYPTTMEKLYGCEGEGLVSILDMARACKTVTSIDTSLPDLKAKPGQVDWRPILKKVFPRLDLFLPSVEEALFMTDPMRYRDLLRQEGNRDMVQLLTDADIQEISQQALDGGVKIVLIKCGSRGMYLRTADERALASMGLLCTDQLKHWANRELWCVPYQVPQVLSTTGAGDTAVAGFICGLLSGLIPEETLELAAYTAAQCVASYDTISNISPVAEMQIQLCDKRRMTVGMDTSQWRRGTRIGSYIGNLDREKREE